MIREPHNGIYYYADDKKKSTVFRGRTYTLRIWRSTKLEATRMAETYRYSGKLALVRKIPFRRGGLFAKGKGKRVIHCYGVYTWG